MGSSAVLQAFLQWETLAVIPARLLAVAKAVLE